MEIKRKIGNKLHSPGDTQKYKSSQIISFRTAGEERTEVGALKEQVTAFGHWGRLQKNHSIKFESYTDICQVN